MKGLEVRGIQVRGVAAELLRREAEGPRLLLMHGAGGNAGVWEELASELSGFDLLVPSLPGRGVNEGEAFESAEKAAAWVDDLLAEIGGPPTILLGHSYGGAIGMELALRSSLVCGLVLIASGAKLRVHPGILQAAELAVRSGQPMSTRMAFMPTADPEVIDHYERIVARTPPAAARADWLGCDGFDRRAELEKIDVPVLVVSGRDDVLTPPRYQEYLVEHLPRAQLCLLDGCGHMLPWERPAELARVMRSWAAGIG